MGEVWSEAESLPRRRCVG